jgi:predicted GNAT family N-acyltransferase
MDEIIYKYIDYKSEEFKQVIDLRFKVLFEQYNKISKYDYDELDNISLHLVALDKEKVVGYSRMTSSNGKGKISNVVVNLDSINRGIGFQMMKRHIKKAKEDNITYLSLSARIDTIEFYKKLGFQCKDEISISEKSGLPLQTMFILIE